MIDGIRAMSVAVRGEDGARWMDRMPAMSVAVRASGTA
jgi:hypothetical protein